jgi:exonuclease III
MAQHYISILFWNIGNKKEAIPILEEIVDDYSIDVVALAECPISSATLALELARFSRVRFVSDLTPREGRITWAFKSNVSVSPVFDGDKVSIREVQPPLGGAILLSAIHASSRMSRDVAELNVLIPRAAQAVKDAEIFKGHDRTIVFGDFNLSPFDDGIISSESFHAVMSRQTALRGARTVYEESRKFFYNPMWKLLAADDLVCGTYHHSSNNPLEYFWHCYDQILFRPSLIEMLPRDAVEILSKVRGKALVSERGFPSISDHLPVVARLEI